MWFSGVRKRRAAEADVGGVQREQSHLSGYSTLQVVMEVGAVGLAVLELLTGPGGQRVLTGRAKVAP